MKVNLKLSRTAIRELTKRYRAVLLAAVATSAFVATGAGAASVTTASELIDALQNATDAITVANDIEGISGVTDTNGKSLNLNDKTISGEETSGFNFAGTSTLTGGGTISGFSRPDADPSSVKGGEYGTLNVGAGSTLNVTGGDWTFSGNNGGLGAVNSTNGSAIINTDGKVVFDNNTSDTQGGGFRHDVTNTSDTTVARITAGEVEFKNNKITSTATVGSGAGTMNSRGVMELLGAKNTFTSNDMNANVAEGRKYKVGGGAVANQSGETTSGGVQTGVFDATMVIGKADGSSINTFTGNHSSSNGGAIMNRAVDDDGNATLTINGDSTFTGNTTEGLGGAIYNAQTGTGRTAKVVINGGAVFSNNTANGEANDIYNLGSLVLNATEGKAIILNGGIDGKDTYKGSTTISGAGYVEIANALKNQNVTNDGELRLNKADLTGTTILGSGVLKVVGNSEMTGDNTINQELTVEEGQVLAIGVEEGDRASVGGDGSLNNAIGGTLKIRNADVNVNVFNAGVLDSDPSTYTKKVTNTGVASFKDDTFTGSTAELANTSLVNFNHVTFADGAKITGNGTTNLVAGTSVFESTGTSNTNTIKVASGAGFEGTIVGGILDTRNGTLETTELGTFKNGDAYLDASLSGTTGTLDTVTMDTVTIKGVNLISDYSDSGDTVTIAKSGSGFASDVEITGNNYFTDVSVDTSGNLVLSDKLINTSTIRGKLDSSSNPSGNVVIGDKAATTTIGTTNANIKVTDKTAVGMTNTIEMTAGTLGNGAKVAVEQGPKNKAELSSGNIGSGDTLYLEGINANANSKQIEMSSKYYDSTAAATLLDSNPDNDAAPTKMAYVRTSADVGDNGAQVAIKGDKIDISGNTNITDGNLNAYTFSVGGGTKVIGIKAETGEGADLLATVASINNAAGNGLTATDGVLSLALTEKGGLQFEGTIEGSKTLSVLLSDDGTIVKDATTGALKVGTIQTNNIEAGAVTFAKLNGDAVTTMSELVTHLADANADDPANFLTHFSDTSLVTEQAVAATVSNLFNEKQQWMNKELGYDTATTDAPTLLGAAGFANQTTGDSQVGLMDAALQLNKTLGNPMTEKIADDAKDLLHGKAITWDENVDGYTSVIDALKTVSSTAAGKALDNTFTGVNTFANADGIKIGNGSDTTAGTYKEVALTTTIEGALNLGGNTEVAGTLTIGGASAITGTPGATSSDPNTLSMGNNVLDNINSLKVGSDDQFQVTNAGAVTTTSTLTANGESKFGKIGTTETYALDVVAGADAANSTVTANAVIEATQGVRFGAASSTNPVMESVNHNLAIAAMNTADTTTTTGNNVVASAQAVAKTRDAINAEVNEVLGGIYKIKDDRSVDYDATALATATGDANKAMFNTDGTTTGGDLTVSLANFANNVASITGGTISSTDGTVNNNYVILDSSSDPTTAPSYVAPTKTTSLAQAIGQISNNIGTASWTDASSVPHSLDTIVARTTAAVKNGVASTNTVNQNIVALNETIGDLTALHAVNETGGRNGAGIGNALATRDASSGEVTGKPTTVVEALNNIDATLGTIHGLKAKLAAQGRDYGNLADGTTVEEHVASVDAAIGDRSQFGTSHYMQESAPIANAMMSLDHNLHRVEKEMKGGFASVAAMSALQPNARAAGDTQISMGAGAYRDHQGLAIGAFHYFNDNIMANVGASYAGDKSTMFRAGVTFGW